MEDSAMGLNVGVSGRKRRLSSDDDETPIKKPEMMESTQAKATSGTIVKEDSNVSSRESTPRIMVGKSARSKRVLSSDSSEDLDSSGDESEKSVRNSESQQSNYSSSDSSSEEESDDESCDYSDSSSSTVGRRKLVKKESGATKKSRSIKAETKKTKRTSANPRTSTKSSSSTSSKAKTKEEITGKGNAKATAKKKRTPKEKVSNSQDESSEEEEGTAYVPRRDRDHKQILVSAILCRWWHVLPDWPPPDTDYQALLKERNLRLVAIDDWEEAPDVDEHGFSKVYQLSEYTGVFRDSKGIAHDLRPKENKPCYSNLIKMEESKLYELLVTALENQIKTLEADSPGDSKLINELKVELVEAQSLLSRKVNKKK
ncbi:hypothetical protein OJ252_437 [Cryptosporidium canis]|uniref:PWWP domain-containing protein n=1 Tax=Cryptosporidium canis TaxID=195482 RepID=A0ABQ8PDP7_9CRYT|nr:hypothetical protein OJ252_437 [Cryptosporidium canis]